ncbi:hypothetical protein BDQ17DRAFT_965806 [Cyathus striatus]|nr:hypothetical protein BDQ17DRAFT_965806 [Cyathus striatus]
MLGTPLLRYAFHFNSDREGAFLAPPSSMKEDNFRPRELTNKDSLLSLRRPSLLSGLTPRRPSPQLSLQLSIPTPSLASAQSSNASEESPALETPISTSSPISGVVDLTRSVKTISREPVAQEAIRTRKRLNREVYVWHRLEHPNVAKLFGTSYHMSGRPAMVMQWYSNGNAAAYLERKGDQ